MPSDIRSFFGGKPAAPKATDEPKKEAPKRGRTRKVVSDDEDEVETLLKKPAPRKAAATKRETTPEGETVSTSDYFGKNKPKRANGTSKPATTSTPVKNNARGTTSTHSTPNESTRSSARKKKAVNYSDDKPVKKLKDDDDERDDIFTADFKKGGRAGDDDYEEGTEDDNEDVDMKDVENDSEEEVKPAKGRRATAAASRKRPSPEDGEESAVKKKKTAAPRKATPKKKEELQENAAVQAIYDSIPTVRPPTPTPKEAPPGEDAKPKKYDWRNAGSNSGPPPGGNAEIPQGEPDCLAGLTFVFTGLLNTISREDGQNLVKQYGGKVTTTPSSKTNYVVLGADAGPKKLETIKKLNLKTIDENGLFELMRRLPAGGGDSKAAAKAAEKQAKDIEKVEQAAREQAEQDRLRAVEAAKIAKAKAERLGQAPPTGSKKPGPDQSLWTVRYAPTSFEQIVGNKGVVTKLQNWLRNFEKNRNKNFRLGGADGSGVYRAVILHGPPGVGKTTAAHLIAKQEGYDVVESNASDTRSKKLVETGLKGVLDTTSLNGYFAGDGRKVDAANRKLVLIMDEVDGMSAGDRGGVGALSAMCRKSHIPIILICNDRKLPKMKPFDHVAYDLPFRRPTAAEIRPRLMTIAFREGMKLPAQVVDSLIEGTNKDIRQVINMLSTAKHDAEIRGSNLDFDESKQMTKAWEKHVILRPWDLVQRILASGMFAPASKATLNQKSELYFNDHEFSYLMLQENYLKTQPSILGGYNGPERRLKALELADKAASSISDGDLVDRMIHGSEQHWALMPTHAIFSFVRPASYVAGTLSGSGGVSFTSWLGKNSAQGKAMRQIKEIQGHMRLRASADRFEIRQQYIPALWDRLVRPLHVEGKEAVPDVIDLMDSYFLTKEDWDSIAELGCGPMNFENVKIDSQAKATFTRSYNSMSHPMPFMKASNVQQPVAAKKVQPDLEEAIEESDEGEVLAEPDDKQDEADNDLSKDKYVRQPKKKGAGAKKAKDADDGEEAPKAKAKGKGKAKAKK